MIAVADFLAGVDIDPNGCHGSLLSFRFPQCKSLRSVNTRTVLRCKARSTPMRECITGPRPSGSVIASPSELRQPMRCGDSECDQRSDSERCFGCCAWRE